MSLSPGSLNLHRKFERPSGRPRRGESQSDESSRDAAPATPHIDLIRKCEVFLFAGDYGSEFKARFTMSAVTQNARMGGTLHLKKRGEMHSFKSSRGETLPRPNIILTKEHQHRHTGEGQYLFSVECNSKDPGPSLRWGDDDGQLRLLMNIQGTNIQNRRGINILCVHHLRDSLERRNNHGLLPQF